MKQPLIILTGPTAVGKTALSIALAKAVGGEIISADSIQVYKYMDIGSAKITEPEMDGIKHYLIDELDPKEEFSAYVFQQKAKKYMQQIYAKGKVPIIVGGTGFYIQALLYDIDFTESQTDDAYKKELEQIAKEKGSEVLHQMLEKKDKQSADAIHANNTKRVMRALQYIHDTGERFSLHNETQKQKQSPYAFCYFVLNQDRSVLYERINHRVDKMVDEGLEQEVRKLLSMGYDRNLVSMQGIGYKEMAAYIDGEYSLEDAIDAIKQDTRHFAKRQLTWFRREREVIWLNKEEYADEEALLKNILQIVKKEIGVEHERESI